MSNSTSNTWQKIQNLFDLYTKDISYSDFERMIKKEAPSVYQFYSQSIHKDKKNKNKIKYFFGFFRDLFTAFILKLTPARRLVYFITIFCFFYGYWIDSYSYLIFSFLLINLLLAFELADKVLANREIDVAIEIQKKLIPEKLPIIESYTSTAFNISANDMGGDYYDYIEKDNKLLIIGDFSCKGMIAAIYMLQVNSLITLAKEQFNTPKDLLITINNTTRNIFKRNHFLTAQAFSFNKDGSVTIARGGHMPLLWFSKKENTVKKILTKGFCLGCVDSQKFIETLDEEIIYPESDDILFFFTDGLVETMDSQNNLYGEETIINLLKKNQDKSPDEIKEIIIRSLDYFRDGEKFHDDITFLLFKKLKS